MVNKQITENSRSIAPGLRIAENPEVALALSYAPAPARAGMAALVAVDDTLAGLLRAAGGEAMLVQMRLTWWRDALTALTALDAPPPPAVPVLEQATTTLVAHGVRGAALAGMVAAWEVLLDEPELDDAALMRFAVARGGTIFDVAGVLLGLGERAALVQAGQGWALADLARHITHRAIADRAVALARPLLAAKLRLPGGARMLSALALLARMDVAVPLERAIPYGAPGRVARLAWHRMTGV